VCNAVGPYGVLHVAGVVTLVLLAQVRDVHFRIRKEAPLRQPTLLTGVEEPLLVGGGLSGVPAVHCQLGAQGQVVFLIHGCYGSRN